MPRPSILIPTYNRPDRLRRALESCTKQTMDFEAVVVDGGSERVADVASIAHDARGRRLGCDWRFHSFPAPGPGFLPTWYTAAALASGEVCHYQLDDDWIEPDFMERTTALLADDVSMVLTQATVHFEGGRPDQQNLGLLPGESGKIPSGHVCSALMNIPLTITPSCATMRRQDVLDWLPVGRIPGTPRRTNCADAFMMLAIMASRPYVEWIAEPLAHLGAHSDGFTISALEGEDKGADLLKQYAEVKAAWMRLR